MLFHYVPYLWRIFQIFLFIICRICVHKRIQNEKIMKRGKKKLPKIVEENNCVTILAAGIVTACKLKYWMVGRRETIGLELPFEISISSLLHFFLTSAQISYHNSNSFSIFSLSTVYQILSHSAN